MNSNSEPESGEWYFDTISRSVVNGPGPDRLGPYATPEQASSALRTVDDRNKEWREDPRWNDKGDEA
ncbi:hypothetical protein AB0D46_27490 [Streptomyces sp. NPDC048383]|uniref:hypothetical protein n=1 Tax=Streptomyces sp. NPDC048383 TaxID=3155386 RepID=UPI003428A3C6